MTRGSGRQREKERRFASPAVPSVSDIRQKCSDGRDSQLGKGELELRRRFRRVSPNGSASPRVAAVLKLLRLPPASLLPVRLTAPSPRANEDPVGDRDVEGRGVDRILI